MKDFHVHERHSGDAREATVESYCRAAEEKGIDEIGFATHLIITGPDVEYSIPPNRISEYFEEIERARSSTSVKLRIGLEVDYFPEEERRLASILNDYPFDFIMGSLHYVQSHDIGSRKGLKAFLVAKKVEEALTTYYDCWREAIESGLFDVMAHPDYYRKFLPTIHPKPLTHDEYESSVFKAIDSLKSYRVGVEVNSSGYRHGIDDCYPALDLLRALKEEGIETVTIGSDSHSVEQLGMRLGDAIRRLEEAGYSHICVFEGRGNRRLSLTELLK
jgi:histidinol-phosphatase (PHP family)